MDEIKGIDLKLFGKRLKELRKSQSLNQTDFGKKVGLKSQMISQYENGEKDIQISTLYKIAKAYDVSTDWLIGSEAETKEGVSQDIQSFKQALETILKLKDYFKSNMNVVGDVNYDVEHDVEIPMCQINITHRFVGDFFKNYEQLENLYKTDVITKEQFQTWVESNLVKASQDYEQQLLKLKSYKEEFKGVTGYTSKIDDEDLKML